MQNLDLKQYVCMYVYAYKIWNWKGNPKKEERDPDTARKYRE